MGVEQVEDPTSYLTLEVDDAQQVRGFQERTGPSQLAFVGVAWIAEPAVFLDGVRRCVPDGELQITAELPRPPQRRQADPRPAV